MRINLPVVVVVAAAAAAAAGGLTINYYKNEF